jgi:hypothetical protein
MQSNARAGDEVVTIGGLYGTVTEVDDDTVPMRSLRACRPGTPARPSRGWSPGGAAAWPRRGHEGV